MRGGRGADESGQVSALDVVELERRGETVGDRRGDTAHVAAFQARVVLDADRGEPGDLRAPQSADLAPPAEAGQARLPWGDAGPSAGQERMSRRTLSVGAASAWATGRPPSGLARS